MSKADTSIMRSKASSILKVVTVLEPPTIVPNNNPCKRVKSWGIKKFRKYPTEITVIVNVKAIKIKDLGNAFNIALILTLMPASNRIILRATRLIKVERLMNNSES